MDLIGKTVGQYRIVEFIGAGGMASVYKAYQASLDRHVAIKVLPAQHALTPGYKERFTLEARAVAQLSHPNILPIYDFGLEGDLSYFVMKYVPDHTLSHLLGRPMELSWVSHYLDQAAGSLDHAHARGILHRDIKPANMLLEGDWLLLADFGVAKIIERTTAVTSSGHIFGTPAYVSPEQAEGNSLDHHTDIYSLGVVLYEMVIGRVPFEDTSPMKVVFKHVYESPPSPCSLRPDLPEEIEQVILKAMAKKPMERYHSAGDVAAALCAAMETAKTQSTLIPAIPAVIPNRSRRLPSKSYATTRLSPGEAAANVMVASATARKTPKSLPSRLSRPKKTGFRSRSFVASLFLLLLVGGLIFLASNRYEEGLMSNENASGAPPKSAINDNLTPTGTAPATLAIPAPITQTPTITATLAVSQISSTPAPMPAALISGTLAIPVKLGVEFKVYVTGFDGAGMNGPSPVSLGHARQPMFRRDGQAIVVNGTSTSGPLRGLFVTDNYGLAPTPINDRGEAYWPVWSPGGTEIMFVDIELGRILYRQRSQTAMSEADYTFVQANNVKIVGNNILWSDDDQLIFQGCANWNGQFGECGIWITPTNVLNPVRLVTNTGLPMDAKQGWLVYMLPDDGDWEIYLISLEGGQPLKLTDNKNQDGLAAIAPDGLSVAYVSNESGNWAIWTITIKDQQKQKWFDFDPQRGTIDVNSWAEERMSWTH